VKRGKKDDCIGAYHYLNDTPWKEKAVEGDLHSAFGFLIYCLWRAGALELAFGLFSQRGNLPGAFAFGFIRHTLPEY
jgi:hypothetical protein